MRGGGGGRSCARSGRVSSRFDIHVSLCNRLIEFLKLFFYLILTKNPLFLLITISSAFLFYSQILSVYLWGPLQERHFKGYGQESGVVVGSGCTSQQLVGYSWFL